MNTQEHTEAHVITPTCECSCHRVTQGLHDVDSRPGGQTLICPAFPHGPSLPPGPEAAADGPADAAGQ